MVSFTVYRANSGGAYVEGVCLATDEKPIAGITNGSILFAVDTTDGSLTRYMFDQNSATWIETECPCSCDGGGEGGTGLPDVDGDDNGKVLTVVEGEWAAAAAPGGEGLLILHEITQDPNTENMSKNSGDLKSMPGVSVWLDAKGEDIFAAFQSGRSICVELTAPLGDLKWIFPCSITRGPSEGGGFYTTFVFNNDGTLVDYEGPSDEYPAKVE